MDQREQLVKIIRAELHYCNSAPFSMRCMREFADYLIANGVSVPVRCVECINNECCSIREAIGENGYCSKGKRRED